jgi:cytochrome b561
LMIVALGDSLIALYHHYVLRDAPLRRITRGTAD